MESKINKKRRFEVKDIVKRKEVITADKIFIQDYPVRPTTIFNPSFKITEDGFRIFARISIGYYTYACSIVEFDIPFEHIFENSVSTFKGRLSIIPDNKYDFWGVEDPRYYKVDEMELITYCGRTLAYFNEEIQMEKTLPVTAIWNGKEWKKLETYRFPVEQRKHVLSDKDAFLFKGDDLFLFHRVQFADKKFYLMISKINDALKITDKINEVEIKESIFSLEPADFESKIGWATAPVKVGQDYIVFIHAMNKDNVYRIFSALLNKDGTISAVTPFYIMEPKEIYEIYGDRPFVVFLCGAQLWKDKIYLTYGAADSAIGIGELEIDYVLDILYKNRI